MRAPSIAEGSAARLRIGVGLALIGVSSFAAQAVGSTRTNQVGCAQRAETSTPVAFDDPHFKGRAARVVLGPVELRGVRDYASRRVFLKLGKRNGYFQAKVALVVQARRSLLLTVQGADRTPVLLAYGSAHPATTLIVKSCPPNTRARTRTGVVGSGTTFTGVFEVPVAECVTLRISNRATGRVWRTRLAFGRSCSGD
jgi:hypothetical protein